MLVGLVALSILGLALIMAAVARPIDPVRVKARLTRVVVACHVPGDASTQCAYVDADNFCYRIVPDVFQPALPELSGHVGETVVFAVDRANYESSRTIGDPFCNFAVDEVVLTGGAAEHRYTTAAMTEPESVGFHQGGWLQVALFPAAMLVGLLAWNVPLELRRRRRAI